MQDSLVSSWGAKIPHATWLKREQEIMSSFSVILMFCHLETHSGMTVARLANILRRQTTLLQSNLAYRRQPLTLPSSYAHRRLFLRPNPYGSPGSQ